LDGGVAFCRVDFAAPRLGELVCTLFVNILLCFR
jgi:hypothetical protein